MTTNDQQRNPNQRPGQGQQQDGNKTGQQQGQDKLNPKQDQRGKF